MIKVLKDWREIGEDLLDLQRAGLPLHESVQKNWDHFLLRRVLSQLPRDVKIVDLGCGGGYSLRFMRSLGFNRVLGIDTTIDWKLRARTVYEGLRRRSWRLPYTVRRGNIVATGLPAARYDAAVCISTIEHGVNVQDFLRESARLLAPGGTLFLTTDYWEQKIDTFDKRAFGSPWKIFCRTEIEEMVETARSAGFVLLEEGEVPPCQDRTVVWNNCEYTFIAVALTLRTPSV